MFYYNNEAFGYMCKAFVTTSNFCLNLICFIFHFRRRSMYSINLVYNKLPNISLCHQNILFFKFVICFQILFEKKKIWNWLKRVCSFSAQMSLVINEEYTQFSTENRLQRHHLPRSSRLLERNRQVNGFYNDL